MKPLLDNPENLTMLELEIEANRRFVKLLADAEALRVTFKILDPHSPLPPGLRRFFGYEEPK